MDDSTFEGNDEESILEHYFFYIEQHCLLLRNVFDLVQSTHVRPEERVQFEKSLYHSLWIFNFLIDHINRLKLEKWIYLNQIKHGYNPRVIELVKNINHLLETAYKDLLSQSFYDHTYQKKCKQMLQNILNQDFLQLKANQSSMDNRQASPPWVNPQHRKHNSLYKSRSPR